MFSPKQDKTGTLELAVVQSTQVVDASSPAAIEITEVYAARQPVADVAATLLE
jgi:hypothetical protein